MRQKGALMEFFNSAIDVLQTLVIALGAGLGIWGVINLLRDMETTIRVQNHKALSSSWRAAALPFIGTILVPLLSGLFG